MAARNSLKQIIFDGWYTGTVSDNLSLVVRQASPDDRPTIIENINIVCAEEIYLSTDQFIPTPAWTALLNGYPKSVPPSLLLVAEVEKQVVGHGRLFPDGFGHKDKHVANVGIILIEPYRELGIGTKLLADMARWAKIAGYEKLTASVFATNRRALNLFARLNFIEEGRRPHQFKIRGQYVAESLLGKLL